jgi:hypothetical protein
MDDKKKERRAIKPLYYERVEWAAKCRHGLSATERMVLMILAMKCDNTKPTESKVSRGYIAGITCLGLRTVDRALRVLVEKKLIKRNIYHRHGVYEKKRTILEWAVIQRDQFVYVTPKNEAKEEDAKPEPSDPLPSTDTKIDDFEIDMGDMAEVDEALTVGPGTEPKTKATPKTETKPNARAKLDFNDSGLYLDGPVKEYRLTEGEESYLGWLLPMAKREGPVHPEADQGEGLWLNDAVITHCKREGLVATTIVAKVKLGNDQTWELARIALPFPEYVAMRLSEHTGKRIAPRETKNFSRYEDGADPYSVLEYALVTESWCTHLRNADKPAGLLFSTFEDIRQSWLDHGGYHLNAPDPDFVPSA